MPMVMSPVFDPATSRVVIEITGAPAAASWVTVRRTDTVGQTLVVRGAGALAPTAGAVTALDSEFAPSVPNVYRASAYTVAGEVLETALPVTVTPDQPRLWLKAVGRPFLSRGVTLIDPGEVERKSRSTAFDIVGSREAIEVNDVHSTRTRTIRLLAADDAEVDALDLLLSFGDVLLVQAPPGAPFGSFYGAVGDTKVSRLSPRGRRRVVEVPLTEVTAPDSTVAPSAGTWRTVLTTYATWSEVVSNQRSWQSLVQLVGSPTDVWVS